MKRIKRNEAITLCSPYPYTLLTTVDKDGKPNIMGLSWWMFTSWDPFMVAIAVGRERYSHSCLEHCPEFVLCFPCEDVAEDAWNCGLQSGKTTDKFRETSFTWMESKVVQPPVIKDSTVAFECKATESFPAGDHTIFVGKVLNIMGNPGNPAHLHSIHYNKLFSMDYMGNFNFELRYK